MTTLELIGGAVVVVLVLGTTIVVLYGKAQRNRGKSEAVEKILKKSQDKKKELETFLAEPLEPGDNIFDDWVRDDSN